MATQVAHLFARISSDSSAFEKDMKKVNSALDNLAGKGFGGVMRGFETMAKVGVASMAAIIGGSAAGIIGATAKFARYEQAIADTTAALGLTTKQTGELNDLVNKLAVSPDLVVSAREANDAISMLGRNGLAWEEIAGGAARATVLLANATGADYSLAADTASSVMQVFNQNAGDMTDIVSQISGTLVASKFDLTDYMLALSQGGGVASMAGVSLEEFNTILAATSSYFSGGSDAGTSFKVFLQRLIPQSKEAEEAMMNLGLMTESGSNKFFDASGALKNMDDIIALLSQTLGGLTEQQSTAALSTIFGTDAMKMAGAMAKLGTTTYDEYANSIGKVSVEQQAAARTDTLLAKWENLIDTLDAFSTKIGSAFAPAARKIVDWAKDMVDRWQPRLDLWFKNIGGYAEDMVDRFIAAWPGVETWFSELSDKTKALVEDFKDRWPQISETLSLTWDSVKTTLNDMKDKFTAFWESFSSGAADNGLVTAIQALVSIGVQIKQIGEFVAKTSQMIELFGKALGSLSRGDFEGMQKWGSQAMALGKFLTFEGVTAVSVKKEVDKVLSSLGIGPKGIGGAADAMLWEPPDEEQRRTPQGYLQTWKGFKASRYGTPVQDLIREWNTFGKAANGGWHGGMTLVGERGPELVDLPGGSYVHTNQESRQMAQTINKGITIQQLVIQGGSNGLNNLASTVSFLNALYG